jgi:hypothetical protein
VRLILGLLLLLMVAVPLFLSPAGAAEPALPVAGGVQAAFAVVDQIPSDSPVLIGLDFKAGYSGELNQAVSGILTQLMQRQARLVLVATDPMAPVLGNRMVDESAGSVLIAENLAQEYKNRTRVVNLGYLPGGTASLQEFVQRPRQAASFGLLTPVDGIIPWNTPILSSIDQLNQFAMVVVITDQPEGGQAWIEQVQPSLGSIPMIVVSSAQAAPMLEPYYQSGQVQGFVSGLTGGVTFDMLSGGGTGKTSTWNAYQSGLIFAALALIAGAVIYGISALLEKGKGARI